MFEITLQDWQKKLKEHEYTEEEDEEIVKKTCPNGIIKEKGKATLVWAHYNNRTYTWILKEE